MKRRPKCRRDYYDETLPYRLGDVTAMLEGPSYGDEPATITGIEKEGRTFLTGLS